MLLIFIITNLVKKILPTNHDQQDLQKRFD